MDVTGIDRLRGEGVSDIARKRLAQAAEWLRKRSLVMNPFPSDDMHWGAAKQSKRIKNIAELDVVITTYTAFMQNEKQLCREIRSWSELARNSLVEFIPAMWIIETKSEDYAPGGHANAIHPRWNKKIRD